jgi:hypothetical protein
MKRLTFIISVLAVLSAVSATYTRACDFCLLSQGLTPLETINGKGVRLVQRYALVDKVYRGGDEIANPGAEEEYWTTEVTGFYPIMDGLLLIGTAPIRNNTLNGHLHAHEDGMVEVHEDMTGDASGMGDITLLLRYGLMDAHSQGPSFKKTRVGLIAGVKLPTGETDKTMESGESFDAHLQPGTGSTDVILGASCMHSMGRATLSANVLYSYAGEGEAGGVSHRFGNIVNYDIGGRLRVYPGLPGRTQVFIGAGVVGEIRGREETDGAKDPDSGGHTVYLSPAIQVMYSPNWVFEVNYQDPVFHDLNGTQMAESFKASAGITYLF